MGFSSLLVCRPQRLDNNQLVLGPLQSRALGAQSDLLDPLHRASVALPNLMANFHPRKLSLDRSPPSFNRRRAAFHGKIPPGS